jgi:hypothetical protein
MKSNNPITYDRQITGEGLVFRTRLDRNRYLGEYSWRRRKWREDNKDNWRPITEDDLAQASQQPSVEGPVQVAAQPSAQTSAPNIHIQNDTRDAGANSGGIVTKVPSPLRQAASDAQQPGDVAASAPPEVGEEVMIGPEPYASIGRAISILRTSHRQFSRRRKAGLAIPKIKLGNKTYFKLDTILALAASGEFHPTRPPGTSSN